MLYINLGGGKSYKMKLVKDKNYTEEHANTWDKLIEFEKINHKSSFKKEGQEIEWIFKGVTDSDYPLLTTLERDIADIKGINLNEKKNISELRTLLQKGLKVEEGSKAISIYDIESGLIRKFKRQCHHYDIQTPEEDNILEWLALMRHYGAPTRLLDWTYSFYVALFFALSDATPGKACAVWALEQRSIKKQLQKRNSDIFKILEKDEHVTCKSWKRVFKRRKPHAFVYLVNPFRLHERLVIQQGNFLCPGDITKTFEENLAAVLPKRDKRKLFKYIIKCEPEDRRDILLHLHRMNINKATLFPGLEGFTKSLKTLMFSPQNLIKADSECKK